MAISNSDLYDLEQLYLRCSKRLYRIAYNQLYTKLGHADAAADIVQNVFLLAGRKWEIVKNCSNQRGWMVKATRYICYNYIRARYSQQEKGRRSIERMLSHQPHIYGKLYTNAAEDPFAAQEILLSLEQLLSEEDYGILKAVWLAALPFAEVSHRTGISETALRVHIHRSQKNIKIFRHTYNISISAKTYKDRSVQKCQMAMIAKYLRSS